MLKPQKSSPPRLTRRAAMAGVSAAATALAAPQLMGLFFGGDEPEALGAVWPFGEVFVVPFPSAQSVDVTLIYPYGEAHNPYTEGLAHYLEHLAWANMGDAHSGGRRHSNALTSLHCTAYWMSRPPAQLGEALANLAKTAAPLGVSDAYALQERDIVLREYDVRLLENRMGLMWEGMSKTLYGQGAFGRSVLGRKADIATFSLAQAKQLHAQTHQLSSATLIVKGPISARRLRGTLSDMGPWPKPRADLLPRQLPLWSAQTGAILENRYLGDEQQGKVLLRRSFLPPEGFSWDEILAGRNVLTHMALSTKPGGLARPLRYDTFIARTFDLSLYTFAQDGLELSMTAEPDRGVSLDALSTALGDALAGFLAQPDKGSFEDIKARELSDLDGVLTPLKVNADRLWQARVDGAAYVSLGDLRRATHRLTFDRYRAFTQHFLAPRTSVTRLVSPT